MQVDAFWLLSSNRFGVQLLLPLLLQNENVNFWIKYVFFLIEFKLLYKI